MRPIPRNSWGGASQALTALRAGRWFDLYGRPAELVILLQRWCDAIIEQQTFRQQLDPLSGRFTATDPSGYSPAALLFMDATWRLCGVREEQDVLHWNVRPGHSATQDANFAVSLSDGKLAALHYAKQGARLLLNNRQLASVQGGTVRVITSKDGLLQELVGVASSPQRIMLSRPGNPPLHLIVSPNERQSVSA